MEVRRYDPKQHLSTIQDWQKGWPGLGDYPWEILPDLGFVAYEGGYIPRAAVFLREAAKDVVYLDHVISDPTRQPVKPYVDALFDAFTDYCRTTGVKYLLTWSLRGSMLERAKKYGCSTYPATIVQWRVR